jgi:hypothetical protein
LPQASDFTSTFARHGVRHLFNDDSDVSEDGCPRDLFPVVGDMVVFSRSLAPHPRGVGGDRLEARRDRRAQNLLSRGGGEHLRAA